MSADSLIEIGEFADRAAVPVKTVRYYADIGLVPPAERTAAGYRRYGDDQRVRLEAVKTLRGLGFSLRQIAAMVDQTDDLRDSIALQLHAVHGRLRELQRTAVVLRAALDRTDEPTATHLARLETLARLSAAERTAMLDDFLDEVRGDAPVDDAWLSDLRQASLPDLPADPTTDQLDAWLELAALLADDDYRASLRALTAASWSTDGPPAQPGLTALLDDALAAITAGSEPGDPAVDGLVARFVTAFGDRGKSADAVLTSIGQHDDERSRRYWHLVARLNQWSLDTSRADAFDWLTTALRHRTHERRHSPA